MADYTVTVNVAITFTVKAKNRDTAEEKAQEVFDNLIVDAHPAQSPRIYDLEVNVQDFEVEE